MKIVLTCMIVLQASLSQLMCHPLKMAYTSVKYNSEKRTFEVSHRLFQDDFENTLKANYNFEGDVFKNQSLPTARRAVDLFFEKNFYLEINKKKLRLKYLRIEQKNQMGIIVWYESEQVQITSVQSLHIYNRIMMESFEEQVNMFNLHINEDIKRTFKFEISHIEENIKLH